MHYLETMAEALLRWADSHEVSKPLCIATAREMLILAEAELKVKAMSRFAGSGSRQVDVKELYDTLRHSSRDISEISRSISSSKEKADDTRRDVASTTAEMAIEKLMRLADVSDQIGDHDLANGIDSILLSIQ